MEAFYWIVLTMAVVFLILILTFIGILMTQPKTGSGVGVAYPPTTTTCPDYWTVSQDGSSCIIPANKGINLGSLYGSSSAGSISEKATKGGSAKLPGLSADKKSINFNDKGWSGLGSTSLCGQKAWANSFNVMWDGVSNYNSC